MGFTRFITLYDLHSNIAFSFRWVLTKSHMQDMCVSTEPQIIKCINVLFDHQASHILHDVPPGRKPTPLLLFKPQKIKKELIKM